MGRITKVLNVGSGDAGGQQDSFAFCLTKVDKTENKIYVMGAHGWKFQDGQLEYPEIEDDIAKIHKAHNLHVFVCETNNTGLHVIQSIKRKHHIPVKGVYTSNNIKSKEVIRKGETMDKKEMVGWINRQRLEGKIVFPKNKTRGIIALETQLNSFVRHVSQAGTTTYKAEGQGHDDFVMAFMVNLFYIRRKIFRDLGVEKRIVMSKKPSVGQSNSSLGSGIPVGSELKGTDVSMPIGQTGTYNIR